MLYDTVVIGGGPAGLSAALNSAAEGLNVLLLERSTTLGGQAGTSSRIENFLGWPNGVGGATLTSKALKQTRRLGAQIVTGKTVVDVEHSPLTGYWLTKCQQGDVYLSRTVVLATGVDYRMLSTSQDPEGRAYYGSPAMSHEECAGKDVVVVGGGNSAGQAALNLARLGANVTLLARRALTETMSSYLIERLAMSDRVSLVLGDLYKIDGKRARINDRTTSRTGHRRYVGAFRVFAYIGMEPRTTFVKGLCDLEPNESGYVCSNEDFMANDNGLFVAGDVRNGSFKRVAAAVGEGAIVASKVWAYIYNR